MSAREKKALLAHWIAQHKTTSREREDAKEDLELWFKRAKLALDAGEVELARAAKDKATEARERYRKATARVIEIEEELTKVRSEQTIPNEEEVAAAKARAQHAASEFQKLGIDPRFAALEHERPAPAGAAATPPTSDHSSALAEADALLDEALLDPTSGASPAPDPSTEDPT